MIRRDSISNRCGTQIITGQNNRRNQMQPSLTGQKKRVKVSKQPGVVKSLRAI